MKATVIAAIAFLGVAGGVVAYYGYCHYRASEIAYRAQCQYQMQSLYDEIAHFHQREGATPVNLSDVVRDSRYLLCPSPHQPEPVRRYEYDGAAYGDPDSVLLSESSKNHRDIAHAVMGDGKVLKKVR